MGTTMWDQLVVILTDLAGVYEQVLAAGQQKKSLLVSADIQAMEQLNRQEADLVVKVGNLETARTKLIREIAGLYNMPPQQLTLAVAQQLADRETSAQLCVLEQQLQQLITEIKSLNQLNGRLLQQALDFFAYNINVLVDNQADPNYAAGKAGENLRAKTLIDAKA